MTTKAAIQSVEESLDNFIQTLEGLSEEMIRKQPSEEEWSIMQIVCHVLEALPYWMKEVENIQAAPSELWGRNHLHEGRLEAVNTTEVRSVAEVLGELKELKVQMAEKLAKLDEATLAITATSKNPNFGTKPISFIVDHLVVEHASKHYRQVQRNLSKLV
jgi:uncharacterized damage-inducible protein DinB